jgi:hypothetical protein
MSSNAKVLLLLIAVVLGLATLVAGGAWYWWKQNSADLLESGSTAMNEGNKHGSAADEAGCIAAVVERHKADGARQLGASVRNSLWLTACLEASKVKDKFCNDVPHGDSIVAVGTWSATSCVQHGFSDPYCGNLFAAAAKYCSSPMRAQKLKLPGKQP